MSQSAEQPVVAAVAGRRIDPPGASARRFPAGREPAVKAALRSLLIDLDALAVVCSAACGADILALETAGELGLRRLVILPFDANRFRQTSVADRPGDWGVRFDKIIAEVAARGDLIVLGLAEGDQAYRGASREILERTKALAATLSAEARAIVVWEGSSRGPGDMTLLFLEQATDIGMPVRQIITIDGQGDA